MFKEVLEQATDWLQSEKRLSYRALKRQFNLDDDSLDDLKVELIKARQLAVDEDGEVLVWRDDVPVRQRDHRHGSEVESRFQALLPFVIGLLRGEGRVTYRMLQYVLGVDAGLLSEMRGELLLRRLAVDEGGKVLVWTGAPPPGPPAAAVAASQSVTPEATAVPSATLPTPPPLVTPSNGPTASPEATPEGGFSDEPIAGSESARGAPGAERRQLTVMFCDLVGSTNLSGRLDPEDLREVVRAYQETAAGVIERYEGHVAQYLGDGLLVYFGYPMAHEDDAQRAVYTGLGIVDAMKSLNTRLEVDYGVQLAVRVGIHTGLVVVGEVGGGARYEQLALGEPPNVAARLEGLASPNAVVISAVTARLVRNAFMLETLGLQALKGVAKPVAAAQVVGLRDVHQPRDTEPEGAALLVGRDEEMGLLRRRWEQSKEGVGQVVLISGEAGIGKSTLVQTLGDHVTYEAALRIVLRCSPYYCNSALYPMIEYLQGVLDWDNDMSADQKLDALEQFLREATLPVEENVPLLATLLSAALPEGRYPPLTLSPHQRRQQTHDILVACLMAEAGRQPVLVMWEDLHWADPSTLEMLGVLIDQTPTVSMPQVLIFRPEFTPPWPLRSHMTPLTLSRLERPQVRAMIEHLAHGKTLPPEVIEHIIAKTDGVPLFVEELTKMLLESTLLRDEGAHSVLTGPLVAMTLPATLQDSLMARLDRLPRTVRVVAQLGAVIGREFDYEMIQALAEVEETTLQAGLDQLVGAELLYQRGRPPRARYIFKHALVQDAAYASLLRSTRRQYHRQVAQLLETRFSETVAAEPELVAHHYTEADLIEEAIVYWQRAGERANDRSANAEARSHLTKGLELLSTLPESPALLQSELALQTILGRVLTAANGYGDAEVVQVYSRARQLCQQIGDTPQLFPVLLGLSIYFVVRAELHTARELGEQLLSMAQRAQDPVRLVEAHYALGVTFSWLGDFVRARDHLEQGSAYYDPAQHPDHLALYGQDGGPVCLCRLAFVLWSLGYPDQALARGHEALKMAQELSHPFSLAYVLTWMAILYHHCRPVQEAQKWVDRATTFAMEQGFPFWYTQGIVLHGWVLTEEGQIEAGIAQIRQGLADMQAVGTEVLQAYYLGLLASAYGQIGQPEAGLPLCEEGLARIDTSDERWPEAELHRLRGELLLREAAAKKTQEAEASFLRALDVARRQRARSPELRAATSLSRLWQQQGKQAEARALLTDVYGWFTEGFDTLDLQRARALLAELAF